MRFLTRPLSLREFVTYGVIAAVILACVTITNPNLTPSTITLERAEQAYLHAANKIGLLEPTIVVAFGETTRGALTVTIPNEPRWMAIIIVDKNQLGRWAPEKTLEIIMAHEVGHMLPACRQLQYYGVPLIAEEVCADTASAGIYGHDAVIEVLQAVVNDPLTSPFSTKELVERIRILEKSRE